MATLSSNGKRGGTWRLGDTSIGSAQVSPPSVDLLTSIPVDTRSNAWLTNQRSPVGPKLNQGSVARWNDPPSQIVTPGMTTCVQGVPPSFVTLATSPREPPPSQRSCW